MPTPTLPLTSKIFIAIAFLFFHFQGSAQLAGTYTINANDPASSTNFQSFTSLAAALNSQGISGHVTVNVVANSGPYTEQVVINTITGSGPNATVTLNGNNDTLKFLTNTTDRHVLRLSNVSYFTLNNLNIKAFNAASGTQFYGVHIFGTGSNITINNVNVDMTGITTTLAGGIVASGGLTSILTAGNFTNITYSNNTTTGGGYGLTFFGTANTGLVMNNNSIYDISDNGIYTRGTNGAVIRDNLINKRTGNVGMNGIQLAQGDNLNASVYNNTIRMEQTATGTSRGIYVFGGSGHKVYNNLIHDFRAETGTSVIGIAVREGAQEIYFNTVRFDHGVTGAVPLTAFLIEFNNTGTQLRNNIFYITQNTTAAKTGITVGSTTTITSTVFSNRNVFWIDGGNVASRGTTTYATLAAWQAAGAQDPNSLYADPQFISGTSIPSNPTIDNQAITIAGITTDITGAPRSSTPDPGAYEFTPTPCSGAVGGTAATTTSSICSPGSATITATGYSSGPGSSYQWEYSNDNFVADVHDLTGQTNPATASTGNISSTTYFRLKVNCTSGTATAYSNIITITAQQPPVITTQPASQAVCSGGNLNLSVQANNAVSYQWKKNGTNISGATAATLSLTNVTAADQGNYTVEITGNAPCNIVTSNTAVITISTTAEISAPLQNQFACEGSSVTFTVVATGTGLSYQWQKGGNPISGATSASYTISSVTTADAGTYNVVVTGPCNTITSTNATLTVSPGNSWVGLSSTDWHTAANWCSGVPTSTTDVTIPSGTPFQPVITGTANVRNLTVNSGATLAIGAGERLNIHGNYLNNGNVNAQGTIAFQGSSSQNVGTLTAGTIIMDGSGGIVLTGNMSAVNLTLTNGNITLGTNNLSLGNSTTGSLASHIITNGTGGVIASGVGTNAFTIPVGPDAASYNPVIIANGGNLNYTVRVSTGVNPAIANNARAINRTWNIVPSSTPSSNVNYTLQYSDAHANASATPTAVMEAGIHNGTTWTIASPAAGITPTGTADARLVSFATTASGPVVIANPGGISYPTAIPVVNADLVSLQLLPNITRHSTLLKIGSKRSMMANYIITDASGRKIRQLSQALVAGENQFILNISDLPAGVYQLTVITGSIPQVLRFIKE